MNFQLTDEERDYLTGLLEKDLQEMRQETHRTDSLTYKEGLHHREALLESLIQKIRQPTHQNEFTV
jgi:hypothetical protein